MRAEINKLVDGHRDGIRGVIERLEACERKSHEWFQAPHTGPLGFLKRFLQDDLGLYFYSDHLVCTTHIGLANTSLGDLDINSAQTDPFKTVGIRSREFSREVGQFLGAITDGLASLRGEDYDLMALAEKDKTLLWRRDQKAAKFYKSLRDKLGLKSMTASTFTLVVTQVNFVHHWLRALLPASTDLFFRARFLAVHYAIESLQQLAAEVGGAPRTALGGMVRTLVDTPEARFFRRLKPGVRNAVAHYRLKGVAPDVASQLDSFADVMRSVSGLSLGNIEAVLDPLLANMSVSFRTFVSLDRWAVALDS